MSTHNICFHGGLRKIFIIAKRGFQSKINNRVANSVDPDDTAHYVPFHQDLHCLQKYIFWFVGMKGLNNIFLSANYGKVYILILSQS